MGFVGVYFFAQNFTLYPMVSIVSVEYTTFKNRQFFTHFLPLVLPIHNVNLWSIKDFARPQQRTH